jgi:Rod binding domain-containing protein
MEAINLFNNAPVRSDDVKKASEMSKSVDGSDNAKKMKVAKEFESILVGQLMNQMKQTIGESGFLEDGSSKQIKDMFWSFLADDVGSKGGFGLWKNIYNSMSPDQMEAKPGEGAVEANLKIDQTA